MTFSGRQFGCPGVNYASMLLSPKPAFQQTLGCTATLSPQNLILTNSITGVSSTQMIEVDTMMNSIYAYAVQITSPTIRTRSLQPIKSSVSIETARMNGAVSQALASISSRGSQSTARLHNPRLNSETKAGIGIGVACGGAIALTVLGMFLFRYRKKSVATADDMGDWMLQELDGKSTTSKITKPPLNELDSTEVREMDAPDGR